MAMVEDGCAKRRGMAAAAAGYGDAPASRQTVSERRSISRHIQELLRQPMGGDAAVAAAATTQATAEEDMETDGDDVVDEEFLEEEDSQSDGQQPESDGEDADGEDFLEVEAEDEGEEEISGSAALAAAAEDDEESQGDCEDYESGRGEESVEEEEDDDEWDEGAAGSIGVNEEGSPKPVSPAAAAPYARAEGTVVDDVMVADADALECGVCFLPLKPPIFQCERGHVVCSPCHDKLKATTKCHVCGVATRGYSRCHAMEHLVASIRVRCPHATHSCHARPAYHNQDAHGRVCPHAPCVCPSASCGFTGSTTALLHHFAAVHGWPCTSKVRADETFSIRLHDGFNFLGADRVAAGNDRGAISSSPPLLFLLNVTQERLGRAVSVLCVRPHVTAATSRGDDGSDDRPAPLTSQCELIFSHYDHHSSNGAPCRKYYQSSEFQVACTDLSEGLPNPDCCFQFVVPNSVLGDGKDGIQVKAHIVIN